MNVQDRFHRFVSRYPHSHTPFFQRPHATRRQFFQLLGAGSHRLDAAAPEGRLGGRDHHSTPVTTQNKAKNVIFILLTGAPSHTDTFDFKDVAGYAGLAETGYDQRHHLAHRPASEDGRTASELRHRPLGARLGAGPFAFPDLGADRPESGGGAGQHRAEYRQRGGDREGRRSGGPSQVFPTFLALNANNQAGPGYFSAKYAPFKLTPNVRNPGTGIPNTTNAAGAARTDGRWSLLHKLDDPLRINSPLGTPVSDYEDFYESAKGLMYNPVVDSAFKFSADDAARYGGTAFGASCLVAKQVLAANQGTRYVQITFGGWDMHQNIYSAAANSLPAMGKQLDDGVSALLADLKASGQLDSTLVVMMGEFGRTVGRITRGGRPRSLPAAVGDLRRRGRARRPGHRLHRRDRRGHRRLRLVSRPRYQAGRHRSHHLFRHGHQLDQRPLRRPVRPRLRIRPFSGQDVYGPIDELWS